jgi:hypothetical protein
MLSGMQTSPMKEMFPLFYNELRRMAARQLRGELRRLGLCPQESKVIRQYLN